MNRSTASARPVAAMANPFELILERLERIEALLAVPSANDGYTTKHPPPGMSRRRFNEICRTRHERGDARVRKFGRVWCADRAVLEGEHPAPRPVALPSAPWTPESALAAAGIRPQRA
jgi:hypothetical protein